MKLSEKIKNNTEIITIIGLGYVGIPLVCEFILNDLSVIGFDIDTKKVDLLNNAKSYVKHINDMDIKKCHDRGFFATTDFSKLKDVDVAIICVPTHFGKHKEPDLNYVTNTTEIIAKYIRHEHLIVLKSTTYQGTTEEVVLPILERTGLKGGTDICLSFSPEREDPGNKDFATSTIPIIVGGYNDKFKELNSSVYKKIGINVVEVSSTRVAEALL